jgi:hypothetical protein
MIETTETEFRVEWTDQERRTIEIARAYSKWVRPVNWQLFGTFTFPGVIYHDEWADQQFAEFINGLEEALKSDVCYIRADERRFSGCGKPACGLHYHALLASVVPMQPALVEWLWTSQVGERSEDAGAFVVPYNPIQGGVEYILKMINEPEGDWKLRNFHLFHPEARDSYKPNARFRRNLRRLEMQQNKFTPPNV